MSVFSSNQGPLLPLSRANSNHSLYSHHTSNSQTPPKHHQDILQHHSDTQQNRKTGQIIVTKQGSPPVKETIKLPGPEQQGKSNIKLPEIKQGQTKGTQIGSKMIKNSFASDAAERYALFNDKGNHLETIQAKGARPHMLSLSRGKKDPTFHKHGNNETTSENEVRKILGTSQGNRWMRSQSLNGSREQKNFKFMIRHFHKHNSILIEALNRFWQIFEENQRYLTQSQYQLSIYDSLQAMKLKMESYLQRRINLDNFHIETQPAADWNQQQYMKYYTTYRKIFLNQKQEDGLHKPFTLKKYKNCVFFGHMTDGKKENGILHYFNGKCFEGQFREDQKDYGLQIDEKQFYLGSFRRGVRHGEGILKTSQALFVGTFTNGQFSTTSHRKQQTLNSSLFDMHLNINSSKSAENKKGFEITHSAVTIYDQGSCVMKNHGGDIFIGAFGEDGEKQGEGLELFANGDIYVGRYESGSPEGYGEYYWENGSNYRGQFLSGMRHGRGVWQMINGDSYEGQYMNDKKNGKGVYIWKNGSKYEGNFENDYRHGYGQMKWQDGRTYKGKWLNGIQKNLLITLEKPAVKSTSKSFHNTRPSFRTVQHDNKKKIPLDKLKSLYNPSYQ